MRKSRFEELGLERKPLYGGWIVDGSETTIDAYAGAGFDYVGIDCQHSVLDESAVSGMLVRVRQVAAPMIVRVSANSHAPIGRVLDSGADAVIIPLIESADDARKAVSASFYPPRGTRSYGPIRSGMGRNPSDLESRGACIVMIESEQGLANVEEIAAVSGVAGLYIGPADLSISLGMDYARAFATEQLATAFRKLRDACEKNGLLLGAHAVDAESAHRWVDWGCHFVSVGSNLGLFASAAQRLSDELKQKAHRANPTQYA